ncbi:hypothetical protein Pelo_527 [Pelomyxa schiedti]|nr:hypothetical protein Pelo_527 [Pelomyxa schiedti]
MGNCSPKKRGGDGGDGGNGGGDGRNTLNVVPPTDEPKRATTTKAKPATTTTTTTASATATAAPPASPTYRPKLCVGTHPRVKLSLLGDYGAGKTSFCCLFAEQGYPLASPQAEFIKYLENLNGEIIMYDTPGDHTNTSSSHYRGASFGLLFYDVQNPGENLQSWITAFDMFSQPDLGAELILVGNKIDCIPRIPPNVQSLLDRGVYSTFNISVKTGAGLKELWDYIYRQIVIQYNDSLSGKD